jgi:hypothetical protein
MADTRYGPPEWPPTTSPQDQYGRGPYIPRQTGYRGYPPMEEPPAPYAPAYPPPRHGGAGTAPPRSRTSVPRHGSGEWRTVADRRPPEAGPEPRRTRREDRSPWHWLLLVPIVVPLVPGLYNRIEPTLLGVPFFYWGQLSFAFLASAVIAFVHTKVK